MGKKNDLPNLFNNRKEINDLRKENKCLEYTVDWKMARSWQNLTLRLQTSMGPSIKIFKFSEILQQLITRDRLRQKQ